MLKLLNFLIRNRVIFLFIFLESVSLWLFVVYNNRYNTYFFNSSNVVVGSLASSLNNVNDYFHLRKINENLYNENFKLRQLLAQYITSSSPNTIDSLSTYDSATFIYYPAKVINFTLHNARNRATVRVWDSENIHPGMGVVSTEGVVGRVKSVSSHYATLNTLLDPKLLISARVATNKALCTVQWDGQDPLHARLQFIPRHLLLQKGDSVFTSGFDTMFPENILLGTVTEAKKSEALPFYEAKIRLATDFTKLETVYIVQNTDYEEIKELEEEPKNE